jgi:hypothetical protein
VIQEFVEQKALVKQYIETSQDKLKAFEETLPISE